MTVVLHRLSFVICALVACALIAVAGTPANVSGQADTTDDEYESTIEAYQTEVADLQGTVSARGSKINAQRTQIAEQKTQIADLANQIPPTITPTPELSGKEAYTWLADPRELLARPHNHFGEKWVFCGSILSIQVASPGNAFFVGDNDPKGYDNILQVYPDGYFDPFAVGFDGDTTGIYEDSYVCVWGTLVDTHTGTNAFGGSILNPLFDAEFLELG